MTIYQSFLGATHASKRIPALARCVNTQTALQPCYLSPEVYTNAVVLVRSMRSGAGLWVYRVPPETSIESIRDREVSPEYIAIDLEYIYVFPLNTKVALPLPSFSPLLFQTISETDARIFLGCDKDVVPFMKFLSRLA